MSSKASFSIGGLKAVAGRTKQKMLQKIGKADETVDIAFNQEYEKLMLQRKMMKKMIKNLKEYGKALRQISSSHTVLGEGIATFYDPTNPLYAVNGRNQQIIFEIDKARQLLEDAVDADIVVPMTAYLAQYNEVKARCIERGRRRVDMDRFKGEVRDATLHPSDKHPDKLAKAQRNYALAKAAFEELNAELLHDIPLLYSDRLLFFDPCFATIVAAQSMYYTTAYNLFNEVNSQLSHLDRSAVHRHPRVITEESCAKKKVFSKDDGDVEAATTQYQVYNTSQPSPLTMPPSSYSPASGYPPSTAYGPPATGSPYGAPGGPGGGPRPQPQPQHSPVGLAPPQQQQQPPSPGYGGAPAFGGAPPSHHQQQGPPQMGGGGPGGPAGTGGGRSLPTPGPRPSIPGRPSNPPAVRQTQARGLYPFQASNPQELSFNPGDVVIIHKQSGDWWEAEMGGRRGLIPNNYVQLL